MSEVPESEPPFEYSEILIDFKHIVGSNLKPKRNSEFMRYPELPSFEFEENRARGSSEHDLSKHVVSPDKGNRLSILSNFAGS